MEDVKFVVYRDNHRVSDKDHDDQFTAEIEADHWRRITDRWPDGTKVVVREKRPKNQDIGCNGLFVFINMNIHRPSNAKSDWPNFEFIGKRKTAKGYTWIRAKLCKWRIKYIYNFEKNLMYSMETYRKMRDAGSFDI